MLRGKSGAGRGRENQKASSWSLEEGEAAGMKLKREGERGAGTSFGDRSTRAGLVRGECAPPSAALSGGQVAEQNDRASGVRSDQSL